LLLISPPEKSRTHFDFLFGFFGSVSANATPGSTHFWSAARARMPAASTKTKPRNGRPVKSITRTCGRASASS